MDVDGVLTDGTVWLDDRGRETKRYAFADVMGVSLGRRQGLHFALISGERGPLFEAIADRFGILDRFPGCRDKASALREFASRHNLELSEVCFVGDDVNDLPAMRICGLAIAPSDAHPSVRAIATIVTTRPGGAGAVREFLDGFLLERSEAPGPKPETST